MANISRSRTIAAESRSVWAVLADFGALSRWAAAIDHSCLLRDGADPRGLARRVQVGRNTLVERIVVFEPPSALAYDIEGLPGFAGRVNNRWDLRPSSGGSTCVTLTTTVDAGSRLTERVVCRVLARQSDGLLTGLARHLEGTTHV